MSYHGNQHQNPWTAAEDALLLRLYPSQGCRCVDQFPGRTVNSLQCRMRNLRKREREASEHTGRFDTRGIEWFLTVKLG